VRVRTIYLVRYGDTSMNAATAGPERERGWSPVALDDMGRKEARRVAGELAGKGIKALVSSDLKRAKQSAGIIGDLLALEPDFVSQLRTWNLGKLTGKLQAETDLQVARLVRTAPDRAPPGGESFNASTRRIFAAIADVLAEHDGAAAIIIHSRIERLLAAWKAAGRPRSHAIDADVFLAQGEEPGHIEICRVNPEALKLLHIEADFGEATATATGDRCGHMPGICWREPVHEGPPADG
jgi:probable phosphoglycerate mutase